MTEAEIFLRSKGVTGDFSTKRMIPTVEKGELIIDWFKQFADSHHESQLKAKMPSEQEIEKAFGMMLTRTENDQNFDSGVKEGIKWLKQQITK